MMGFGSLNPSYSWPIGYDPFTNLAYGLVWSQPSDQRAMRPMRTAHQSPWLSRDDRRVLIVWSLFAAMLALCALIGSLSDGLRPKRAPPRVGDDAVHTGSILFVPADGERCWQRLLDNQTGRLRDNGFVSCEAASVRSLISSSGRYSTAGRLDAIRKGFSGGR